MQQVAISRGQVLCCGWLTAWLRGWRSESSQGCRSGWRPAYIRRNWSGLRRHLPPAAHCMSRCRIPVA